MDKLTQASLVVPEMVVRLEEAESLLHSGGEAERLLHSRGGGGEDEKLLHSSGSGGEAESLLHSSGGGEAKRLLYSSGGGCEAERLVHSESSTTHKEEFVPHTRPEDHSTTLRIELEANLPSTKEMLDRDPLETED